jgi:hypothetical protein
LVPWPLDPRKFDAAPYAGILRFDVVEFLHSCIPIRPHSLFVYDLSDFDLDFGIGIDNTGLLPTRQ